MEIKDDVISWDYDGTLDHHFGNGDKNPYLKETRDFVLRLIRRGYDVHIITRRYGPENSQMGLGNEHLKVWKTADELGIPRENIIFTNREWKYSFIESIGACMHIDDDEREKYWIERHLPEVEMVWLGDDNWKAKLISKIESHDPISIWMGNNKNIVKFGIALVITLLIILFLT
jgi:hypothetical protein